MIRIFYVTNKNFYYKDLTRHSAGKIWSSICIQDIGLHCQNNPTRLTLPVPISDDEKKLKAFIKPFEAPQRSLKIKI